MFGRLSVSSHPLLCRRYSNQFLYNGISYRSFATKRDSPKTGKSKGLIKKDKSSGGNKKPKDIKNTKLEPKELDDIAFKSDSINDTTANNTTNNEKKIIIVESSPGVYQNTNAKAKETEKKKDVAQEWRRAKNLSEKRDFIDKQTLAKKQQLSESLSDTVNTKIESKEIQSNYTEMDIEDTPTEKDKEKEKESNDEILESAAKDTDLATDKINSTTEFINAMKSTSITLEKAKLTLVRVRAKSSDVREVLREMNARGLRPNIRTYLQLVSHAGTQGDVREAVRVLAQAREASVEIEPALFSAFIKNAIENEHAAAVLGVVPEMAKYYVPVTHVRAAFASMRTQQVVQISAEMEHLGKDLSVDLQQATMLAIIYTRFGNVLACQKLYEEFKNNKATPELQTLFKEILTCLQRAQAFTQFWSILGSMRDRKIPFNLEMLNSAISCMSKMRDPSEKQLVALYDEIKEHKFAPNLETYESLIYGMVKCNIKHARQRYHQMIRENITPSPRVNHILIKGYLDAAMMSECIELLHAMRRAGLSTNADDAHLIALRCAELSDHAQASHFLEFFSREPSWLSLETCRLFAITKQTEKLQALESTMQKRETIHFCHEGKLLDAISILKKMREANMKLPQDTWRPLVAKLIKDGFKEDARKVVDIAEQSGADVSFTRKYIDKL